MCPELHYRSETQRLAMRCSNRQLRVLEHSATGDRYLLLGDAFTFIDPMFSSGVFLAMQSAFDGAEVVATALDRPAELPAARRALEKRMRAGPRDYSWFIYRVTNPTIRDMFIHPNNVSSQAGLDVAAGGRLHHGSAIAGRLVFKVLYYVISGELAAHLRRLETAPPQHPRLGTAQGRDDLLGE